MKSRAHMQIAKILNSSGNIHYFEIYSKGLCFIDFINAGVEFFQSKCLVPIIKIHKYMNQVHIYDDNKRMTSMVC